MSTQTQLNLNWTEYILYYCNSVHADATVYATDCSTICTAYFDGSGNIQISSWLIGAYVQPVMSSLLAYSLATVSTFFANFYTIPAAIVAQTPYSITTTGLAAVRADASMIGYMVLDTTARVLKTWTGSTWITLAQTYLPLAGGTMSGAIAMGGNAITNALIVSQTAPSALTAWSSAATAISMTTTAAVISIGSFTTVANPAGDFSFNTSTGQATYNGSATKYFRVSIGYSLTAIVPLATQTVTTFISKSGSTTVTGAHNTWTFVTLNSATTSPGMLCDVIQLATGNTIQLAGVYTASASITFANLNVAISQV